MPFVCWSIKLTKLAIAILGNQIVKTEESYIKKDPKDVYWKLNYIYTLCVEKGLVMHISKY